jgi:HAE1 family hydrophobic/amphiphilic exporter-1
MEQIENLIITTINGSPVRVSDVAEVLDGAQEQSSISRFNGQEGISISIKKQSNANAVKISEELHKKISSIEKKYESKGCERHYR